ncbi:hypothetical protein [Halovulum sp. GXIMD14793]
MNRRTVIGVLGLAAAAVLSAIVLHPALIRTRLDHAARVFLKAFRVYLETSHKIETRTPYRLITAFRDNPLAQVYPETL